jgi:hypothetical protein
MVATARAPVRPLRRPVSHPEADSPEVVGPVRRPPPDPGVSISTECSPGPPSASRTRRSRPMFHALAAHRRTNSHKTVRPEDVVDAIDQGQLAFNEVPTERALAQPTSQGLGSARHCLGRIQQPRCLAWPPRHRAANRCSPRVGALQAISRYTGLSTLVVSTERDSRLPDHPLDTNWHKKSDRWSYTSQLPTYPVGHR